MLRKTLLACLVMFMAAISLAANLWEPKPPVDAVDPAAADALRAQLKNYPCKIVFQSYKDADKNWELYIMNADGSDPRNLTKTPDRDEYYPQCSFDGKYIAYEADAPSVDKDGKPILKDGKPVMHSQVWVMNADGGNQRLVSDAAEQPTWSHDSKTIAFMKDELPVDAATLPHKLIALAFYDMNTGKETPHRNKTFTGAMNLSFTSDDQWIAAVVSGAIVVGKEPDGGVQTFNVSQTILAIQTRGDRVIDLIHQSRDLPTDPVSGQSVMGCRPDISHDGKRITWAVEEKFTRMWIAIADLGTVNNTPVATNWRWVVTAPMNQKPSWELYHPDWSPDDRFIAFSKGIRGSLMQTARFAPRTISPSWNIAICDPNNPGPYVQITDDGQSNKEPDFLPIVK